MKPKIKAKELVDRFYNLQSSIAWDTTNKNKEKASIFNDELGADVELYWHELAKQTALIAVNLAIEYNDFHIEFLQEVKQEINNL